MLPSLKTIFRSIERPWAHACGMVLFLLLSSCSQEQAVPVTVDFALTVVDNDFSVPVQVAISNRTTGAESYQWAFEGADRTQSTERNPGTLVYNQPGTYTISLEAANADGSMDNATMEITLDAAVNIGFDTEVQTNNFAPATFAITNTTIGATSYQWTFEGGDPETSSEEQPGTVVFANPGEHTISLVVGNGRETHELEKTVTVGDALTADFEYQVAFQDDDFQVPVQLQLQNNSTGALTYSWTFSNGQPASSTDENPTVVFDRAGTHTLQLTVSNAKEERTISKTIQVFENTNLRTLTDVRFGVNTAHTADVQGAFFSITNRETYTASQLATVDGSLIDLVFFGLGADFSFNKFVSPDNLADTTFEPIPNAGTTVFINSQEQCGCSASLGEIEFDQMMNDTLLNTLTIEATQGGVQHFTDAIVPRIVLFQTADGRKGAIKVTAFIDQGQESYILTDIKVQKESR